MHAGARVGQIVGAFKPLANIVGIEDSILRGLAQTVWTIGENVSQRAHEHPEVAVERAHAPDGLRTLVVETQSAVALRNQHRARKKRLKCLSNCDRARPWSSAAVGR